MIKCASRGHRHNMGFSRYGEAGASELVLTFAGRRAEADMQYLANAARRSG